MLEMRYIITNRIRQEYDLSDHEVRTLLIYCDLFEILNTMSPAWAFSDNPICTNSLLAYAKSMKAMEGLNGGNGETDIVETGEGPMRVQCSICGRYYDDARCWTICPHGPLEFPLGSYCPRCDTVVEIHGKCEHQQDQPPTRYEHHGIPIG